MNTLDYEITFIPGFNDHQIRFFVDGEDDWLSDSYLGIDPHHFFAQANLQSDGYLWVGRCVCGYPECDDRYVKVQRSDSTVRWIPRYKNPVEFKREEYDFVMDSAQKDTSWEDNKRTAERIISQVFIGTFTEDGYKFDWTSARIKENTISLSFSNKDLRLQKFIEFSWDEKSIEDALITAKRYYKDIIKQVS